jgi:hypothetical protein
MATAYGERTERTDHGPPPENSNTPPKGTTRINVNVPSVVATAIEGIAEKMGMSRTDVIVRALTREAYFARLAVETPDAKIIVERPNGKRQELVFL